MRFRDVLMTAATQAGGTAPVVGYDADAELWFAAVVTAGGSVSAARKQIVSDLVTAMKSGGSWAKLDDCGLLCAESSIQALVSLKQRRTGTAVNSPTFGVDTGYVFNGTTNYINTGFVPSTHSVVMTTSNMRIAAYERTNLQSNTNVAGSVGTGNANLRLRPRTNSNERQGQANCDMVTIAATATDSRGYTEFQRDNNTYTFGYNGAAAGTATPGASATIASTYPVYVGVGSFGAGTQGFRAATVGLWLVGASLTVGERTAEYTAIQAYMTSLGANV